MKMKKLGRLKNTVEKDDEKLYSHNNTKKLRQVTRVFMLIILLFLSSTTILAASKIKIKYNGKVVYYKNQQLKVSLDNKAVDLGKTPGVVMNGTNMVAYTDVFNAALCAKCTYNKKTGKLVIKQNGIEVKMTVGKKTAYVNGKKKTLSEAPKLIYFYSQKKTKLYVPAKFVATSLGYKYTNNTKNNTISFKSPAGLLRLYYDEKWNSYTGTQGKVTIDNNAIDLSALPLIVIDKTSLVPASKVFTSQYINAQYQYDKNTKKVTIQKGTTLIELALGSTTAYVNSVPFSLKTAPRRVTNKSNGITNIMVPAAFVASQLGYNYAWNAESKTSVITTVSTTDTSTSDTDTEVTTENYSLKIALPPGVIYSSITNQDDYLNLRFNITVPGNQIDFYTQNPIINMNPVVTQILPTLTAQGNTNIAVTTKTLQGYKLIEGDGYFTVRIDEPSKIYSKIVVLDPGHGGTRYGAVYNNVPEKSLVYNILYANASTYFNGTNSTVKAYWTRVNDTDLTNSIWYKSVAISNISASDSASLKELKARAAFSKYVQADLFISLHLNAASSTSSQGIETFSSSINTSKGPSGLSSVNLAKFYADNLSANLGMKNRGNKEYTYLAVCRYNTVPSVLIELGFMTNSSDFTMQNDPAFQLKAAGFIYNLTEQLFVSYPTGR